MTHPGWGDKWADAPVQPPVAAPSSSTVRSLLSAAPPGDRVRAPRPPSGRDGQKAWRKPPEPRRAFWTHARRRYLRVALGVTGGLLTALVLLAAWVAVDGLRARAALDDAAAGVAQLKADAVAGRTDALDAAVAALQADTRGARDATSGPHWAVTSRLPVVGPTVEAVATMANVLDDLATGPLADLPGVVRLANPATFAPVDGRVDLAPLQQVAPDVVRADEAVDAALQRVSGLDGPMLPPVADAVQRLELQLADVRMTSSTAARAAQVIPSMMGAAGPRDYLVLVQNPAEPRALGGIVGSVLVLRAEGGAVSLVDQLAGRLVGPFDAPVVDLTQDEQQVLGDDEVGRWMLNVSMTPDFPRAAEIAREMWRLHSGNEVSGVLSVDPVLLADLLKPTGPFDTGPGGLLQGDALVDYLLNGVYKTQDPAEQDRIFADVAERAFEKLAAGTGDSEALVNALAISAREGRLLVWSADGEERALLTGTVIDGALRGVNSKAPVIGSFVQGFDAAKIGYYLDSSVSVEEGATRPDGSRELAVTVTYTSRVPADEVPSLPEYITGPDLTRAGEIYFQSLVFAPAGGSIAGATENGAEARISPQVQDGLSLASRSVTLRPGETTSVTYAIITGKRQTADVIVRTTPGTRPVQVTFAK